MAPLINETIYRTPIERQRAILSAGYDANRRGLSLDDNPYFGTEDSEDWIDGYFEYSDDVAA